MVPADSRSKKDGPALDAGQYTIDSILKYELAYGRHFVSPGGHDASMALISKMGLSPGDHVLDVGCGLGGCAFLMASHFKLSVDAIDLSENMIALASERLSALSQIQNRVHLSQGDCLDINAQQTYQGVYSRDVFLHIENKKRLFTVLHRALADGGVLLFTDYCCSEKPWNANFSAYVKERGYHLYTVSEYEQILRESGFEVVAAEDATPLFIAYCESELERIRSITAADAVRSSLISDWIAKIDRARAGNQRWGQFVARKSPASQH